MVLVVRPYVHHIIYIYVHHIYRYYSDKDTSVCEAKKIHHLTYLREVRFARQLYSLTTIMPNKA